MLASLLLLLGQAGASAATPTASAALVPVCLTHTVTDSQGGTHPFAVVVRQGALDTETLTHFTPLACTATGLDAVKYRTEVCRLASLGNEAVQARLEYVVGAPPKVLCAEATALGSSLATILTQGS